MPKQPASSAIRSTSASHLRLTFLPANFASRCVARLPALRRTIMHWSVKGAVHLNLSIIAFVKKERNPAPIRICLQAISGRSSVPGATEHSRSENRCPAWGVFVLDFCPKFGGLPQTSVPVGASACVA